MRVFAMVIGGPLVEVICDIKRRRIGGGVLKIDYDDLVMNSWLASLQVIEMGEAYLMMFGHAFLYPRKTEKVAVL